MRTIQYIVGVFFLTSCATLENPMLAVHDHGMRAPASVDCEKVGWNDKVTPAQQEVINEMIAERGHRMQHALWHSKRGGLEPAQEKQVLKTFGPLWADDHPLCPSPKNNATSSSYNPSGEDFLYMHRQMIEMLREAWVAKGLQCVRGWEHVPNPTEWPLPSGEMSGAKSPDAMQLFQAWDNNLQNPGWLKKVSLSELGFAVEFTIHNNLHMRYAEDRPAEKFRGKTSAEDGAVIPYDGKFPGNWKFDDPSYNWLADPYSAAVNPIFWKIHGYVDYLIDVWLAANNYRRIAENCGGENDCYEWKGMWVGGMPTPAKDFGPTPAVPGDPARDKKMHRERMKHQQLGVVDKKQFPVSDGYDRPKGPVPAPPPPDVLVTARKQVCGEK